jgi:hypothetical protein
VLALRSFLAPVIDSNVAELFIDAALCRDRLVAGRLRALGVRRIDLAGLVIVREMRPE